MDRVERLAFNALPAALTADMWTHVYVQQANSVFAGRSRPNTSCAVAPPNTPDVGHGENPSGECQTTNYYGVSHFPCCITNFPQGWPKFAMNAFVLEPHGSGSSMAGGSAAAAAAAVVVASLVPASAILPPSVTGGGSKGGRIVTDSEYPFGDTATITVTGVVGPITVKVRIPGWADKATVNGKLAANGTMVAVVCPSPSRSSSASTSGCTISVALNPEIKVEKGWGFIPNSTDTAPATNGASITRGPLVFALHPKEIKTIVKNYSTDLPVRPKAVDYEIATNDTWNYALVLPPAAAETEAAPPKKVYATAAGLRFDPTPSAGWSSSFPFDDSGEYPFSITVQATQLKAWGYWEGSKITAVPPASPVDGMCSSIPGQEWGGCGNVTELRLVPFGSTNLRISVFPWLNAKTAGGPANGPANGPDNGPAE